ncbi:DUF4760 domain-containing protein [Marinicella litoralis]|uniref:Uncharacterized protein DUF4760 n=1 Tax=Marinicella litoralis TaxID=644220 RepID=A0A4R6X6N1_9GAMM|nr:DUF4760 domain-containing protein [Marinicella litoralis]TDR14666.1 uncharacterized protein DUF4760 [Marinicella litoralis]
MKNFELVSSISNSIDFSWTQLVSPICVVIAALLAAMWAKKSINANESITKKRCTMDYIMSRSRDQKFVNAWSFLRQADKAKQLDVKSFADTTDNSIKMENIISIEGDSINCKQARDLLSYFLNQYEYMATGVHAGIYDEAILLDSTKTSTIKAFAITKVFIDEVRKKPNAKMAYKQFETLVNNWNTTS